MLSLLLVVLLQIAVVIVTMCLLLQATLLLLQVLSHARMSVKVEEAEVVVGMRQTMMNMVVGEAEVVELVAILQYLLLARML